MNKSILTANHMVKIRVDGIIRHLSEQSQDILKEELHSEDLKDIEVGVSVSNEIYFIKKVEY